MPAQIENDSYRPFTGLIYLFNLIVGTGALTMPAAFKDAGWLVSLVIIVILCLVSYITTTFVVEAMSVANAVKKTKSMKQAATMKYSHSLGSSQVHLQGNVLDNSCFEKLPLLECNEDSTSETPETIFNITQRVELGAMASLFFNKIGVKLFYLCIAIYLYGDLAIYAASISKSLRDVTCNYIPANCTKSFVVPLQTQCWENVPSISRQNAYRLYLAVVLLSVGPFAFFNLQKTKYLQILTSFLRWTAFISMITLATITLFKGHNLGKPKALNIKGIPNLFGVCVYSFMCHHSLPGLITPINRKKNLFWLIFSDYCLILLFYSLLSFTGIFAFPTIDDIYTLNFQVDRCAGNSTESSVSQVPFLNYFLPLFPVFTLSTSFPIIAVTLTMNLKTLFLQNDSTHNSSFSSSNLRNFFIQRLLFPIIAVIPPFLLAFITENLEILVGVVGSYAGAIIQYVIPALLAYCARKRVKQFVFSSNLDKIEFFSPFSNKWWIWIVLLWSVICIIFVTTNHIIQLTKSD